VDADLQTNKPTSAIAWLPMVAAIVALVGLGDSIYLTIHHYTGEQVACTLIEGCDMVLQSPYATLGGMIAATTGKVVFEMGSTIGNLPLAAAGALSYLVAFALAILAAFGNSRMWKAFGAVVVFMFAFTLFLLYVQGYLIGYFCQFCLLSAGTTFTLLLLFIVSIFVGRRSR